MALPWPRARWTRCSCTTPRSFLARARSPSLPVKVCTGESCACSGLSCTASAKTSRWKVISVICTGFELYPHIRDTSTVCHPERSEGSAVSCMTRKRVLRFAQDDKVYLTQEFTAYYYEEK